MTRPRMLQYCRKINSYTPIIYAKTPLVGDLFARIDDNLTLETWPQEDIQPSILPLKAFGRSGPSTDLSKDA